MTASSAFSEAYARATETLSAGALRMAFTRAGFQMVRETPYLWIVARAGAEVFGIPRRNEAITPEFLEIARRHGSGLDEAVTQELQRQNGETVRIRPLSLA